MAHPSSPDASGGAPGDEVVRSIGRDPISKANFLTRRACYAIWDYKALLYHLCVDHCVLPGDVSRLRDIEVIQLCILELVMEERRVMHCLIHQYMALIVRSFLFLAKFGHLQTQVDLMSLSQ